VGTPLGRRGLPQGRPSHILVPLSCNRLGDQGTHLDVLQRGHIGDRLVSSAIPKNRGNNKHITADYICAGEN
jgi:hypothetical protein